MDINLDFEQYVPVQHTPTAAYFAFRAIDNKDFDAAEASDTYRCYPLQKNGFLNPATPYVIPRKELQSILLRL